MYKNNHQYNDNFFLHCHKVQIKTKCVFYKMNFDQNPAYEDDVYIYGNMAINETNRWVLPSSTIVVESLITSGRFADIYKAMYRPKGNNERKGIVVAKILKSKYNSEAYSFELHMY